jgi:DNA (cytosine-5)-methyltransferase 1
MIQETQKSIRTDLCDKRVYAVDLFCGAGGLTKGLTQAGIDVKLGVDADPACKYAYTANNDALFLEKSVEDLKSGEVECAFPRNGIRLLAGCAPCQTFSTYNQKSTPGDKRWWLLKHFSRLVEEIRPELVTMENVPGLQNQDVFQEFIADLQRSRYLLNYWIVNCADYGIPQHRHRLVLLASRLGPIHLMTPVEFGAPPCSVRNAISGLPPIRAGEVHRDDLMHQSSALSSINLRRIRSSKPGGSWRDWRDDLVAECHRKATGKTYPSVYGRMCWDEPAPTITTQFFGFGNGRFGHPEQDRAISLREGAILQSFPSDYVFAPKDNPLPKKTVGRLIGNAVPVQLGKVIGRSILRHIAELDPQSASSVNEGPSLCETRPPSLLAS